MSGNLVIEGGKKETMPFPDDIYSSNREDIEHIMKVLVDGKLSLFNSDEVEQFEKEFREYVGCEYCISTVNCTSALDLTIKSLELKNCGIILPAYSYAATLMPVLSNNLYPVFADINLKTFTIDMKDVRRKIAEYGNKIKAIMPVHMFGVPCDMKELMEIACDFKLRVIEDCAHSLGAKFGAHNVGFFDVGCFSFGENKILRLGEGGMLATNDEYLYQKAKIKRHEGEVWLKTRTSTTEHIQITPNDLLYGIDYHHIGHNFRFSALLAALGRSRLRKLNEWLIKFEKNAQYMIKNLKDIHYLRFQSSYPNAKRVYYTLAAIVDPKLADRDVFLLALAMEGVPVGVHFPMPLPDTKIYRDLFPNEKWIIRNTRFFCKHSILLPIYPSLSKNHLDYIIYSVRKIVEALEQPKRKKNINKKVRKILSEVKVDKFFSGMYFTVERK